ncbi:MAG: hypothetical protein Q9167_002962 [Letrouitia subvulpina]
MGTGYGLGTYGNGLLPNAVFSITAPSVPLLGRGPFLRSMAYLLRRRTKEGADDNQTWGQMKSLRPVQDNLHFFRTIFEIPLHAVA